jgi:hypothetical protein
MIGIICFLITAIVQGYLFFSFEDLIEDGYKFRDKKMALIVYGYWAWGIFCLIYGLKFES